MNVVVFLRSSLRTWTLEEPLQRRLCGRFPDVTFTFASDEQVVRQALGEADAFWGWVFRTPWVGLAPRLAWIATPAAGLDWIASRALYETDVLVTRGSFHGRIMAESVLAMMLFFERRLGLCLRAQATGDWPRENLDRQAGVLAGKTLCVVGAGHIGTYIGRLARAFGMRVLGVRRTATPPAEPFERIVDDHGLHDALAEADHVAVALPSTAGTRHLINASALHAMKPGAYFYNVGRGSCVDEGALAEALLSKRLAGAGLDVFEEEPLPANSPLRHMPNVLVTPHGSAVADRYMTLATDAFARNLACFLADEPLEDLVDRARADLWEPALGSHGPAR